MNFEIMDIHSLAELGVLEQFLGKYEKSRLNEQDKFGRSCLHCSIAGKKWDTVNFLLDEGIDVNLKDKKGNTALRYMLDYMRDNYEEGMKILKRLLDMGANVNEANKDGGTPLLKATGASNGSLGFERWKLLLQYNPDIYKKNNIGRSCYSMAKEYCDPETWNDSRLFNYLVENGFIKDEDYE